MADEGGAVAVADGELDGGVDQVGEVADAVLEGVVDDLEDAGLVLQEGDFGRFVHFESAVDETIFRLGKG